MSPSADPPVPVLGTKGDWTDFKPGLTRVNRALRALGHPDAAFASILVGGTNGKGTVATNLARNLSGTVGLFTSPHLEDVRERIRINGELLPDADWQRAWECVESNCPGSDFSYFEWLFLIAVCAFQARSVDQAVFEVGMGGRLDATNCLQPVLSLVTNVGLDHQRYLGTTIGEIALEKIEIARRDRPFYLPRTLLDQSHVKRRLKEIGSDVRAMSFDCTSMAANRRIVELVLTDMGTSLRHWSDLPGRREKVEWFGPVWFDGAHNIMAWRDLANWIEDNFTSGLHLALSVSGSREPSAILKAFQRLDAHFVLVEFGYPGERDPREWPGRLEIVSPSRLMDPKFRPLVVTGSLYAVAQARELYREGLS